jgi:maleate cis-trans isomerase
MANRQTDACFIGCTAIRSAGLIVPLEAEFGIPVITSNQVMLWHALTLLGSRMGCPDLAFWALANRAAIAKPQGDRR